MNGRILISNKLGPGPLISIIYVWRNRFACWDSIPVSSLIVIVDSPTGERKTTAISMRIIN